MSTELEREREAWKKRQQEKIEAGRKPKEEGPKVHPWRKHRPKGSDCK